MEIVSFVEGTNIPFQFDFCPWVFVKLNFGILLVSSIRVVKCLLDKLYRHFEVCQVLNKKDFS